MKKKMPRIDPLSLLKCLSVLLGPTGGIKSKEEVHRLANLMTKFSKKLVSKCIYIQILKTTNAELLSQFMGAGGWNLIHMWLTDGILAKNWALIQELLELLLLCPVDIERLKSNNCPKLIKGLSKEGSQEAVQVLAGRLVEQWLKIVKGEAAPNSLPPQITSEQITAMGGQQQQQQQQVTSAVTGGQQRHQIIDGIRMESHDTADNTTTIQVQDLDLGNSSTIVQQTGNTHHQHQLQYQDQIHIQPVQLQIINKTMPGQSQPTQIKKQSFVVVSSASSSHPPSVPVYKITIRDGKQVLTKVETDASNITNIFNDSAKKIELNGELKQDIVSNNDTSVIGDCRTFDDNNVSDKVSCEVKQSSIICKNDNQNDVTNVKNDNDGKDIVGSDGNNKSSDKENRDSHKKDEKSSSSNNSSSDSKKSSHHSSSKGGSRHGSSSSSRSSSNSHRSSSHRSSSKSSSSSSSKSSRDKDRHSSSSSSKHSSSSSSSKSKSDRDKERDKEKEKLKKDQAEKDKATLEKVQAPSLGTKFGKIPKKKADDEKTTGSDPLRKSSTDSRDSSKENKDKGDSKKSSPSNQGVLEKKNISISIENKKNSQDNVRPKTVKTFNSKFRSTGLEEEVKPPPPRSTAGKKTTQIDKKIILSKLPSLKRPSPLRDTGATTDKRAKLALDSPVTPPPDDTKKGAIKLIPPKPKPMVLQESDMFMDALMTASTKNKEPRKRKRRTSITKDTDSKKSEGTNSISNDLTRDSTSPPSSSPSGGDERSTLSIKPEFKFYQDTLETDEDKEDKERMQDDKDDESLDEKIRDRCINDDEDERSRTPTCDDDSQDAKAPASPDDPEDTGRKAPSSPNAEIRYVDGLRSVLILQKRKGPKKSLKWKTELESVRYFELDETERVNVTKTFTDMKQMEKQNEREAFQMARKLSTEDLMEERTRWNVLIPIDLPAALVEPGKDSKEKDIQYAREKGILQALYFNRSMIPDSPAEPDEERHHVFVDARIIPLDDLTGNKESEKDFTSVPWPEPKPQLAPTPPVPTNVLYPPFPQHNQTPMPGLPMPPVGMGPMVGAMSQQMPPSLIPPMNHMAGGVQDVGANAGGWRTGDGKVVVPDISTMNNMPNMPGNIPTGYPPPIDTSMMPPGMMPPPGMFNQQDGYPGMMQPEDGSFGHMPNNFQGPGMFVPGPNFQTGPPPPPPRGAVMNPMHGANRGRGGPGWFRGVGPMRGGGVGGGGTGAGGGAGWGGRGGGGWRGNGKQPPVCRQFTKNGYCRAGDKCQYLHPGLNCPPF